MTQRAGHWLIDWSTDEKSEEANEDLKEKEISIATD